MGKRNRDHKAEHARRRELAAARGLSKSQARGHPKPGEAGLKPRAPPDERLVQTAAKALREHGSLKAAAKALKIAPERLKYIVIEAQTVEKHKGRWRVRHDLPRRVPIYSRGRKLTIKVKDFESASLAGQYMSAVGRFLETNKVSLLEPFDGLSVTETSGKRHVFETNPNTVLRLAGSSDPSFAKIYRIVVRGRS